MEKLIKLYEECINELKSIGIDITNSDIGEIDIMLTTRNTKRYGCCKCEEPDKSYYHKIRKGYRTYIKYDKYKKHHIEISNWVMKLDDNIIKNTIMHEIIHCMPYCINHGDEFKKYAKLINEKLGYNITRLGNKEEDYKMSNLEYLDIKKEYNYEITCDTCGQISYRHRLAKNFSKKYKCAKCGGNLTVHNLFCKRNNLNL